jgi:hypothetical protein
VSNDEQHNPPQPSPANTLPHTPANTLPPMPEGVAPAAKKPNQFVRIGIGCMGVIALGCVAIGGLFFFQMQQQEQNYAAGNKAYVTGDCATAIGPLGKAASGDPGSKDSDVARKAEAELQECQAIIAAEESDKAGDPAAAIMAYSAFLTKYDQSPLRAVAIEKGQELFRVSEIGVLASADVCNGIDDLQVQTFILQPSTTIPPLLAACGQAAEDEGAFAAAVDFYDRFRTDYPDHELFGQVSLAFARVTIADAEASGAGELPTPQQIGDGSGSSDQVTVVIQNDSPEALNIIFSGPETRVETIEACTECAKFSDSEPESCPELGATGTYLLAPGSYTVVVKAGGGSDVTPFRGTWDLEGGQEYSSCFYIVTSGS